MSPQALVVLPIGTLLAAIFAAVKIGRLFEAHRQRIVDIEIEVGLARDTKVPPAASLRQRVGDLENPEPAAQKTSTALAIPS